MWWEWCGEANRKKNIYSFVIFRATPLGAHRANMSQCLDERLRQPALQLCAGGWRTSYRERSARVTPEFHSLLEDLKYLEVALVKFLDF